MQFLLSKKYIGNKLFYELKKLYSPFGNKLHGYLYIHSVFSSGCEVIAQRPSMTGVAYLQSQGTDGHSVDILPGM